MEQKGTDDFLADLAEEEPDAAHFAERTRPEETEWPVWSRQYYLAWLALRDDRFYGSMGGAGRIYYTALSRYAEDHNMPLYPFMTFVRAIDGEFVEWVAEQDKKKTETD